MILFIYSEALIKISNSDENYNYVHDITKSGITYKAYSSKEIPVFDFSNIEPSKRVAAFRIADGVQKVTFKEIEVTGVLVGQQKQSECFRIEGNAEFDRVVAHDNQANGFYFVKHGTGTCIRCDSYNNIGVEGTSLGNTDGFGAHGDGVIFKECRAWNCSDDGFDCISSKGPNTFDNCWAFNMNAGGDSNGFKIGGYGNGKNIPPAQPPVHTVKYCLSVNNGAHGFYANHQPGQSAIWTYNTAYNNALGNFNMLERVSPTDATDIPGTREVLHYNLAYKGISLDQANLQAENNTNNSWNIYDEEITSDDFKSLDVSELSKERGTNGGLPHISFMKLSNHSKFKRLGCFK